ncbi:hypothetical protein DFH07DRAFT_767591 [Mycena maculata]|uniref:Zn(2)-C6 fungal-type domain-containing protein n=1 Tax=Mycena maculata TaxID=230809 RepID=A0AAD7JX32_9AGAR|nr:hypothetical protein DFH07DRAFT_767591 [Mycena maculata]
MQEWEYPPQQQNQQYPPPQRSGGQTAGQQTPREAQFDFSYPAPGASYDELLAEFYPQQTYGYPAASTSTSQNSQLPASATGNGYVQPSGSGGAGISRPTSNNTNSSSIHNSTSNASLNKTANTPSPPRAAAGAGGSAPKRKRVAKKAAPTPVPTYSDNSDSEDGFGFSGGGGAGISVGMAGLGVRSRGARLPGACTHCKKLKMKCDFGPAPAGAGGDDDAGGGRGELRFLLYWRFGGGDREGGGTRDAADVSLGSEDARCRSCLWHVTGCLACTLPTCSETRLSPWSYSIFAVIFQTLAHMLQAETTPAAAAGRAATYASSRGGSRGVRRMVLWPSGSRGWAGVTRGFLGVSEVVLWWMSGSRGGADARRDRRRAVCVIYPLSLVLLLSSLVLGPMARTRRKEGVAGIVGGCRTRTRGRWEACRRGRVDVIVSVQRVEADFGAYREVELGDVGRHRAVRLDARSSVRTTCQHSDQGLRLIPRHLDADGANGIEVVGRASPAGAGAYTQAQVGPRAGKLGVATRAPWRSRRELAFTTRTPWLAFRELEPVCGRAPLKLPRRFLRRCSDGIVMA